MTNPDLAALSEAATQALAALEAKPGDGALIDAYLNASGVYHATLERLHRAGRLVQIDEGMREMVVSAMLAKLGPVFGNPEYLADPVKLARAEKRRQDSAEAFADAAIAAMMGGAK